MENGLSLDTALRLMLVYAHLLLCVFALAEVLGTDWRLLRSRISARHLLRSHRRVVLLLAGLWLTGVTIIALDGLPLAQNGKLMAKIACVSLLTMNGLVLRYWCFPRLVSQRPLQRGESWALMCSGATSTTCWLMAGFYGVARPLASFSVAQNLLLLAAALAVALPVALSLSGRLREGRRQRQRGGVAQAARLKTAAAPSPPASAALATPTATHLPAA